MNMAHEAPEILSRVDLNLLVAFDALVRERNVTNAARRVGVTQSAMSHSLRRLRDLFADPLLVRSAEGMALTPRAEALVVPLRSGLVALGRVLAAPAAFDAKTARRAFSIVSPDLFDVVVIPRLLEKMPSGVDLAVVPAGRNVLARLETGELDVALVPRMEDETGSSRAAFLRKTLLHGRYACFVRRGHPVLGKGKKVSLDAFCALAHLLVSPTGEGGGQVDDALAESGRSRRIALRVPHFTSALAIVERSDLVLTGPDVLAKIAPASLVSFVAPLRLPGHGVDMLWHERFTSDAGHAWFRERLTAASRG